MLNTGLPLNLTETMRGALRRLTSRCCFQQGNVELMLPNKTNAPDKRLLRLRLIALYLSLLFALRFAHEPAATSPTTATSPQATEAQKSVSEADALRANWTEADLRKALQHYDSATAVLSADPARASAAAVQAGDVCFLLSEFAEAIKRYETAAALAEKGHDRLVQGRALSKIGRVYGYQGNTDLARAQLTRALALLKTSANDPNLAARSAYGEALTNLAEVTYSLGNLAKVLDQLDEAGSFLQHDQEGLARIHLLRANTAGSLGAAERALVESDRAWELYKASGNKVGEGLTRITRAMVLIFKGPADKVTPNLDETIQSFRSIGDRHSQARATIALGQAYQVLGDRQRALINYENGLRLYESIGDLYSVAVMSFKLATMYVRDYPEKALPYYERSLALSREHGFLRNEANAFSEIALVYASQNRPDQATQQYRQAQEFFEKIGDRRGQLTAMINYGDFVFRLGQKQQALEVFNEALPLSREVGDTSIFLDTLFQLARVNSSLGNYETALSFIDQSLEQIEKLRAGVDTPDLRTLYFSGVRQHYDLCIDILMKLQQQQPAGDFGRRAFLVSEKSRARSLIDLVREIRSTWREGANPNLLRRERETIALIRSASDYQWNLSLNGVKDPAEAAEVAERITKLTAEYREIQGELRAQNQTRPELAEFELKDVRQVQRELQAGDSLLLEYSLGNERSYLWATTGDSFQSYELPARKELEDQALELYNLLTARQQSGLDQASAEAADKKYFEKVAGLSQTLLGPVATQLGSKRLIVVREGALQLIPFDALIDPRNQDVDPDETTNVYLSATNEVVALPSMSTLLAARAAKRRSASSGRVVAVFADPVFGPNDDRVQAGSSTVAQAASLSDSQNSLPAVSASRLIYSAEEADAISAMAPGGSTMMAKGFEASRETAMSQRVGEYQVVHFATHGFLNADYPELSAIVLTSMDQNGGQQPGVMPLNDIYSLDLSAELVVLSACQTALGKDIKGEGLIGLPHAFMSAGSKSVVASLWKVDDRATALLMSYFYEGMLKQGLPASAALRAAKLKMMQDKQYSAPYYWAGFVFQGDYESRVQVGSNSRLALVLALVILVLVSAGLIIFLRRRRRLSPAKRN